MSSESTEKEMTVHLPSDLDDWLDEQAADVGMDREAVLVQVLAAYRATSELDGDVDAEEAGLDVPTRADIETAVDSRLEETLDGRVEQAAEAAVAEATNAVQERLGSRIDSVEAEFQGKIEDVRERVIQVKKEADSKAPADHTHEEFERLDALDGRLDDLQAEVADLESRVDETLPEQEKHLEETSEQLETLQERLQTVAWAVRDLRDSYESETGLEAVDRIKRAAAKADIDRARCENCGNGVDIALLTDPNCPHCDATVTDVEKASGFFSKPQLLAASQLDAGETR